MVSAGDAPVVHLVSHGGMCCSTILWGHLVQPQKTCQLKVYKCMVNLLRELLTGVALDKVPNRITMGQNKTNFCRWEIKASSSPCDKCDSEYQIYKLMGVGSGACKGGP